MRVRRSYRLPPDVVAAIDALSVISGLNRTAVVVSAVRNQVAFVRDEITVPVTNENQMYESLRVDCDHRLNGTGPIAGCPSCERQIAETYREPHYDGRSWYISDDYYALAA